MRNILTMMIMCLLRILFLNTFNRWLQVLWQKIDRSGGNNHGNQSNDQEQLTLIAFDGVVYSNKDHYRLESDYVGSYNLIIDRVNEDDQGEYQCQINTEPRKTKRIFLTVQGNRRISNQNHINQSFVCLFSSTSNCRISS